MAYGPNPYQGFNLPTGAAGQFGVAAEAGTDIAGIGLEALGTFESYQGAKAQNAAQIAMIGTQQAKDQLAQQAATTNNRRAQLEALRKEQQARSLVVSNSASKTGTQQGSGTQGGLGQVAAQGAINTQGYSIQQQFTDQAFSLESQLNNQKIAYAQAQLQTQKGTALGSFGKDILSAGAAVGKFAPLLLA